MHVCKASGKSGKGPFSVKAYARRYGELLREIRQENITNILFFDTDQYSELETEGGWTAIEGSCLVVFKDGHLEQAYIPPQDIRMQCALRFTLPENPCMHDGALSRK